MKDERPIISPKPEQIMGNKHIQIEELTGDTHTYASELLNTADQLQNKTNNNPIKKREITSVAEIKIYRFPNLDGLLGQITNEYTNIIYRFFDHNVANAYTILKEIVEEEKEKIESEK